MKVLYINSVCDYGSTGRITSYLSCIDSIESLILYGRKKAKKPNALKITSQFNVALSMLSVILGNNYSFFCKKATLKAIQQIEKFKPDIIHIHNLHGYYIDYEMLFSYINGIDVKVIWTFHDCWPMTGYCCHFEYEDCQKYKDCECDKCIKKFTYPYSIFKQKINEKFKLKKSLFTANKNLTIVTPSNWLEKIVKQSFLKNNKIVTINNGIDLKKFKPKDKKNSKFRILFVSNIWTLTKGKEEIEKIIRNIYEEIEVIIIGKIEFHSYLKSRCVLCGEVEQDLLIDYYCSSHLFVNPTLEDTFPTVNIESLACGTPVITYNTGGSPEIIDNKTGIIVKKGDYISMASEINKQFLSYKFNSYDCVERSKKFSVENMKKNYFDLYKKLIEES